MTKRCVVIGGTGQVGGAVCRALAAADARVAFTYFRSEERGRALADELHAPNARLDARNVADVGSVIDHLVSTLGGLDALVHCAGRASTTTPAAFDESEAVDESGFDELFDVNVKSAFFTVVRAARHLGDRGGNVVLLGSVDGVKGLPSPVAYASSKGAISAMARSFAKDLGCRNVRINVAAPGILEAGASAVIPDRIRAEYLKHTCARRYGRLDEAAALVTWLALSNTYLTGQTLSLDGGL